MNISKVEQNVLHVLARGGAINVTKNDRGKITELECATREGWSLDGLTLIIFRRLKRRRLIASSGGGPYRITRLGRVSVRSQLDNCS